MAFNATAADKKYTEILVSLVAGEEPTLAQLKDHQLAFNAKDNLWFVENHTVDPVVITKVNTDIMTVLMNPGSLGAEPLAGTFAEVTATTVALDHLSFMDTTPVYSAYSTPGTGSRNTPLIKIGSWDDPLSITQTSDHWVPIQVNIRKTGNVAYDIAAARFRVDTAATNALSAVGCLQLRQNIGHAVASSAILNASVNVSGACTVGTGSLLGGYFSIEGSGAVTKAGGNDCTVLTAVYNGTGGGIDNVFVALQNGSTTTVSEVVLVDVTNGTATVGVNIDNSAGTLTTGLKITGTTTTGISISGQTTTGIDIGVCTTGINTVSPIVSTSSGRFAYQQLTSTATIATTLKGINRVRTDGNHTSGHLCGTSGELTIPTGQSLGTGSESVYGYGVSGQISLIGTGAVNIADNAYCAAVNARLNNESATGSFTKGHISCLNANIYGINTGTFASVNGIYVEHGGGGVINSFLQLYGKTTYVFDIASNTHTQVSLTGTCATNTAAKGWLMIKVDGATRYIPLAETVS